MFVFGLLETKPLRVVPSRVSLGVYAVVVFGGVAALYPVLRDYGDDPSRLFGAWGDYGMATLLPLNAASLPSKLYAHQRAIA
ncbi:polymerase, partial [Paraburkholderia sp. EG285A]